MEQALSFEGTGLDLDNNYATVNPGDSPFRLNCRYGSTDRSDLGGIQNFKGDTLIANAFGKDEQVFVQPDGLNEVIGSCKDLERDAIIYFVWNEFGKHQIRRYYTQTNQIQVILESPVLNFQRNFKIFHANVVDKYLSWTDGYMNPEDEWDYNPPRQIDMELAYGYMLGLPWPQGYQTIDEQTLDAVRYSPQLCPTFEYMNDLGFEDNRLYGHLFQFGYRYVYYDNSISVISPLSKLTLPQGEDLNGNYELQIENMLRVTVETGHYTVKTIELIAKEGASWKVVDTIDKYNESGQTLFGSTYTFQFYNTKFIAEIPIEEALRPFDYVPQVASAQEVISSQGGARRVYGAYVEGYENVENLGLTAEVKVEKIDPEDANYKNISFKRKGTYQLGVVYSDNAGRKSFVQTNPGLRLTIPWWQDDSIIAGNYNANDEWVFSSHQKPYINWSLQTQAPEWATSYQIVCTKDLTTGSKNHVFMNFGTGTANFEKKYFLRDDMDAVFIPSSVGYDFTEGDRIRLVAYFDGSQNPNIQDFGVNQGIEPKELGQSVPLATATPNKPYQLSIQKTYNDPTNTKWDFKIEKFDPSTGFAKIQGNINLSEITFYVFQIYNSIQQNEENAQYFEIGESRKIINGQINASGRIDGIDCFVRNSLYAFKTQLNTFGVIALRRQATDDKADPLGRVILRDVKIGTSNSSKVLSICGRSFTPPDNYQIVGFYGAVIPQFSIEDFIERADATGINSTFRIPSGGISTYSQPQYLGSSINVDTPNTAEIKESAINSDGYVTANINTKCKIQIPNVDFKIKNIILELNSYSSHYQSETTQTGRPYIINKEAVRRKYFANLIWGGQFFDNTLLNYFSRYESSSVLKLNEKFNEITKIQEVGFMLKVRQRNKSTSIYVGRTELTNADGSSNLAASNNVLGTINVSDEIWGGTNGTADCRSIRDTYFFDYINGTVVRDATNGLVAISGNLASQQDPFRMTAFFRDLSDWFKANEADAEVISVWDNHTQSVIFTIRSLADKESLKPAPDFVFKYKLEEAWNEGLTLSFHEPTNRWQTFHSYVREWYESIGNTLVSFNEGNLYLHYSNETRTEYMGVKYPVITAQICNQFTNNVKVFDNIDVYSNRKWKAEGSPINDDIYILPNAQFVNGMRSKLSYNNFVGKEGKWHASFLCDINSPGFSNTLLALMNGRRLRGEAMKVALRNEDIDEVFLRQVIFHFTPSELSGGG